MQGWGGDWGVSANGVRLYSWVMAMFWNQTVVGMVAQLRDTLKVTELYALTPELYQV